MHSERYSIGLDFGTLSGRALLCRLSDGAEVASAVYEYPHGVMDDTFAPHPGVSKKLPGDWALQHPDDYIEVVCETIPRLLADTGVDPAAIVGLGIDFTACSPLPVYKNGVPLCRNAAFADDPHAYVKLWKHHAAQPYANRVNALAEERGEKWLSVYGGKISSEWLLPKTMQLYTEAPDVYDAADHFIEAGDWLVWQLTGVQTRNSCMTGYKGLYTEDGYPSSEFLAALESGLANVAAEKWGAHIPVQPIGSLAGYLTPEWAAQTGLTTDCAVSVAVIDGHAAVPAAGVHKSGQLLAIMGTSTCHMLMESYGHPVPGTSGYVADGMMPGLYGFEAGQCCVGDHFAWVAEHITPESYKKEAAERNLSVIALLSEKASLLSPGESGLLALDWWNGNRSVLIDAELSGMLLGMTLTTRAEEIYRALVEATAFGTRKIVENFRENGVPVEECIASGGIAEKSPFVMQIYADVLGMDIRIAGGCSALGAAIFGATAAGERGYATVNEASAAMGRLTDTVYRHDPAKTKIYNALYAEYLLLHDYFGRGENDVMKRLRAIREQPLPR